MLNLMRPDFYQDAACRGADPELFFDPDNESADTSADSKAAMARTERKLARRAAARSYCQRCPVAVECLRLGLECTDGMFGGYDKDERRRVRRMLNRAEPTAVEGPESEDDRLKARALELIRRNMRVKTVMQATGLDYQTVVTMRNRYVMSGAAEDALRRREAPTAWSPGVECYFYFERRWVAGQYLGESIRGGKLHMLVQQRNKGISVRKWCKAEDVVLRPDVPRYSATHHSRKDLNVAA